MVVPEQCKADGAGPIVISSISCHFAVESDSSADLGVQLPKDNIAKQPQLN